MLFLYFLYLDIHSAAVGAAYLGGCGKSWSMCRRTKLFHTMRIGWWGDFCDEEILMRMRFWWGWDFDEEILMMGRLGWRDDYDDKKTVVMMWKLWWWGKVWWWGWFSFEKLKRRVSTRLPKTPTMTLHSQIRTWHFCFINLTLVKIKRINMHYCAMCAYAEYFPDSVLSVSIELYPHQPESHQ